MSEKLSVKIFQTRAEAEMAQSYLQSEGIRCQVKADDCGGMHAHLATKTGGAHLLVSEKDFAQAQRLLSKKK
ncbi:MAG: hypothetical protein COX62_02805 [Deltaproteobacteria bacterium CG_4_10_14_0_2_um_filter_43_8]|nr:MAG: hypothetical protein COV43_02750 [Deltaproteobacteria bacterium CG11_big_fil_rev_8_21_14_0_20_42_23]PJA21285.1 MAG: hypothetical protein COX62_02805 [Deltaproteobacteria bacterium CG_4_10_14_0_2_um_filter_43_8]PJC63830.1 MAG: hypothetical protein CO021_07460 [Deltaproteobacteria bacterium CG_4_9_14_0_2_um_filter_42_21]